MTLTLLPAVAKARWEASPYFWLPVLAKAPVQRLA